MAKTANTVNIKEKLAQGHLHVRVIFEIIGNPKRHVVDALSGYLKQVASAKGLTVLSLHRGEPEEHDKLWHTFADLELLVLGVEKLTWLCFNFAPASVEILAPSTLAFKEKDFTDWLNDLLARLHELSAHLQASAASNAMLQKNINAVVYNGVLLALQSRRSAAGIGAVLGLPADKVEPFLEQLVKDGKALKNGEGYVVAHG